MGPSNVSAWMRNAVSELQFVQTCMHMSCSNLLALKILFTNSLQLTALLHVPLISLHAQVRCQQLLSTGSHGQQGPLASNVSAWMSNAVYERKLSGEEDGSAPL